jgi:hypothetical protein
MYSASGLQKLKPLVNRIDAKSPLSGAAKHPDFGVTLCLQNVSINIKFVYLRSEIMPIFYGITYILKKYRANIGLSIRKKEMYLL